MRKTAHVKSWRECRVTRVLLRCQWERKMVWLPWKVDWSFLMQLFKFPPTLRLSPSTPWQFWKGDEQIQPHKGRAQLLTTAFPVTASTGRCSEFISEWVAGRLIHQLVGGLTSCASTWQNPT